MKSTELAKALAPFAALANKHAMSPIYKALEISADTIRGCAPWGILEVSIDIGTKNTFWVDANQFIGIVKTLPADEFTFELSNTTLSWQSGRAKGKLALLSALDIPQADWEGLLAHWIEPNAFPDFATAVQLGGLSASRDAGMSSAGVSGVAFTWIPDPNNDPGGDMYITSSDNVTMSLCLTRIEGLANWPSNVVINTEAAAMLVTILKMAPTKVGAFLDFTDKSVTVAAGDFRLMVRNAPPMKHDLLELCSHYTHETVVAELPKESVKRFVARATALAEAKAHTHVTLSVQDGAMALAFSEGGAQADEHYLAEGLGADTSMPDVHLDATRLARALSYTDHIAFDDIGRSVITLFNIAGKSPEFSYLINGSQDKSA